MFCLERDGLRLERVLQLCALRSFFYATLHYNMQSLHTHTHTSVDIFVNIYTFINTRKLIYSLCAQTILVVRLTIIIRLSSFFVCVASESLYETRKSFCKTISVRDDIHVAWTRYGCCTDMRCVHESGGRRTFESIHFKLAQVWAELCGQNLFIFCRLQKQEET